MNILILGNGFDIYHKLPTRYTDFLYLIRNWNFFYNGYIKKKSEYGESKEVQKKIQVRVDENGKLTQPALIDFINEYSLFQKERIERLNTILKNNFWIQYFIETNYEKDGWIDFEKEMEAVLQNIELFFSVYLPKLNNRVYTEILDPRCKDILIFLIRHTSAMSGLSQIGLDDETIERLRFGKVKEDLLNALKIQLDCLIEALDIYFDEFVSRIAIEVRSNEIESISDPQVLCFNYTESYFDVYKQTVDYSNYHAIHGSSKNNDLVLGISDSSFDVLDYVYFQKYFQRIQKKTGVKYLDWIKPLRVLGAVKHEVFIFGHSLGMTDKGVLDNFFLNEDIGGITIYYHNQKAYEELVIALIAMYGKEYVIEQTGNKRIRFLELEH